MNRQEQIAYQEGVQDGAGQMVKELAMTSSKTRLNMLKDARDEVQAKALKEERRLRAEEDDSPGPSSLELYNALEKLLRSHDALMPGVKHIALQDYALLNEAPMEARQVLKAFHDSLQA